MTKVILSVLIFLATYILLIFGIVTFAFWLVSLLVPVVVFSWKIAAALTVCTLAIKWIFGNVERSND